MKKMNVLIVMVIVLTVMGVNIGEAQETNHITFTDSEGKGHRYELAGDSEVAIQRSDKMRETIITYVHGALSKLDIAHSDGPREVFVTYENGALSRVETRRDDGLGEAFLISENGELLHLTTGQFDENTNTGTVE